jgi:hypothetical protein
VTVPSRFRIALAVLGVVAIGALAFLAYGGVGHRGTPKAQLALWVHDTGLAQSLGTLRGDNNGATEIVSGHRGTGAVHTICGVLTADTATAMSYLPSPNTELTQLLARAYQLEYQAGTDCYSAGSHAALQVRSAHERAAGQRLLDQAAALITTQTGSTLSTTTTTSGSGGGIFG